eukprot:342240_1
MSIEMCNTNKLISENPRNRSDFIGFHMSEICNVHRFVPATSFFDAFKKFDEIHHVPEKMQILCGNNQLAQFYETYVIKCIAIWESGVRRFILFDRKNTIIFCDMKSPRLMSVSDKTEPLSRVVFIKWFDIFFQQIIPLQFMILDGVTLTYNRILKYVENEFIATTNHQKKWHSKLLSNLKDMNYLNSVTKKLIINRESQRG